MHIVKQLTSFPRPSEVAFSYEFFCPDSDDGFEALRSRVDRLSATEPLFIDIVSVGGFEDIRRGLRLCRYAKKVDGLSSMLHIACADVSIDEVSVLLEEAKGMGIDNLLLERGVPSSTSNTVRPQFVAHREGFSHVRELIAHIRKRYGSYFCLGVMGYPSGYGEYSTPEEDMKELKLKCDTGANFVITQHVNDARTFTEFRDRALSEGISVPMIPSLMPVLSYSSFVQVNAYCGVPIPAAFLAGLHSLQEDDKAVREYGNRQVVQLAKDLIAAGASVLHFHTMNLEVVIRNVLQDVGLCGPGAGTRRKLPWRPSGDDYRASEDVRPIFWANRPESYLERTAGWLNFPSGRWGSNSTWKFTEAMASYGDADIIDAGGVEERRSMWGASLSSHQDAWEIFARYVEGRVPRLPWCDATLLPETSVISLNLARINRAGFLTINSQPRVNAARSDDPTFGWGGTGGYVYQKAYIECFTPPSHLAAIMEACSRHDNIMFQAVDMHGNSYSTYKTRSALAVTWGVFPAREILQPTVVHPDVFLEWKKEAFALWSSEWAPIYDEDSTSRDVVDEIQQTYFLVNLVDNDYVKGDIFKVFDDAISILRQRSDRSNSTGQGAPASGSPQSRAVASLASASPSIFELRPASRSRLDGLQQPMMSPTASTPRAVRWFDLPQ